MIVDVAFGDGQFGRPAVVLVVPQEPLFSFIGINWHVDEPVELVDEVLVVVALVSFDFNGFVGCLGSCCLRDFDFDLMISKETISKSSSTLVRCFFLLLTLWFKARLLLSSLALEPV